MRQYNPLLDTGDTFEVVYKHHYSGETFREPGLWTKHGLRAELFRRHKRKRIVVIREDEYSAIWKIQPEGAKSNTYYLTNRKLGQHA